MNSLSLKKMSTEEKIEIMETLWEDLCQNAESLSSPDWHLELLRQREKKIKDKKEQFLDWDASKKQIRNAIS